MYELFEISLIVPQKKDLQGRLKPAQEALKLLHSFYYSKFWKDLIHYYFYVLPLELTSLLFLILAFSPLLLHQFAIFYKENDPLIFWQNQIFFQGFK